MYFAIQNLVMSTVIILSTGLLWPNLRDISLGDNGLFGAHLMPYIVMTSSLAAFFVAFILPKSYKDLGKEKKLDKQIKEERVK